MTRCSKCKHGNLVKVSETGKNNLDWMIECNFFDEPEYINLSDAELEELDCDLYEPNVDDDHRSQS